jgi:hypothetical protein
MPIQMSIEFYRSCDRDDSHAVLGRVTREADDLDDAVEVARTLLSTPDAMTISDAEGKELCRRAISHRIERDPVPSGDLFVATEGDRYG